jgi:hypothetical protein
MTEEIRELRKDDATEFLTRVKWPDEDKGRIVFITRKSNHGTWIKDGGWVACIVLGPMNPWYVSADGLWRYKYGDSFKTADDAYKAARRSRSLTQSRDELDPLPAKS